MRKSPKLSPEVVERAVRMVFEGKDQYPSQWAAIESIAGKIGCTAETLRRWVRQTERDQGLRDVLERLPTQPASRIAELLPHRWHPASTH
jgi:transposase